MSQSDPQEGFQAPDAEDLNTRFQAFKIERLIAVGGMGAVYEAEQTSLERKVAIKVLPREFGNDEQFRAGFKQEAKVMAKLMHPNLVSIFDSGEIDGMLYLVMEYVDGSSLHDKVAGQPIDQDEAIRLVQAICLGLQHAHELGLIHRDIKPANILLTSQGVPKITDFGLAGQMNERPEGELMGTPQYMPPELIRREGAVDQRADIYSLCVILYELLTGKLPAENYVGPSSVSDSHPSFDSVLAKGLHPNPALRIQTAVELSELLAIALEESKTARATDSRPATKRLISGSVMQTAESTAQEVPAQSQPQQKFVTPTPQPKSSNNRMAMVATFAVLLVVGGIIFASMNGAAKNDEKNAVAAESAADEEQADSAKVKPEPTAKPKDRNSQGKTGKARFGSSISIDRPKGEVQEIKAQLFQHQTALQFGERDMLPEEAIELDGRYFLLIDEKKTWFEALKFCERFNAQLACFHGAADFDWLLKSGLAAQTDSEAVWSGAYLSENLREPAWIDSGAWTISTAYVPYADSSEARFLATSLEAKRLEPTSGNEELPFVMEFKTGGGEAPGSYEVQLMRVKGAIERGAKPQWPAGSVVVDGRCFTVINTPNTWQGARISARKYGAQLAVVDSDKVLDSLGPLLRLHMNSTSRAWIGGRFILGKGWRWQNGPDWDFAPWADGQPTKFGQRPVGLQLIPGDGDLSSFQFKAEDADEQAELYVVSWAIDAEG